ncbi:arginine:ornithine antiporter [Candidatus Kinetoplastibacterium oncopeltii TCC290E]|uniref:Arginine:ornithine antiporter n=1 Tax=Candidatus Kinetoplastidibacterium stringomonadis TCC290E TaxID=1208920 RepID=M1LZH0_9PROT|nr:basic amino acid/polyamine antiporter [Candidatus Kinetoplastibacterium oncopeltii]AGF48509.1 arginine:ornithine antiporter [Candidatus Kinetoplastibacterium oncopeltii TCC290E]
MSNSNTQKLSVMTLTAMVVGSMIGAGIFSLPQNFAQVTGVFGALIAWTISGLGMLMLAFVFQSLSCRKPNIDSGVHAYAQAGFGDYLGFSSALGYWAGTCLGNVTYLLIINSTIGSVFSIFGDGTTLAAVILSSSILWSFHFLVLRGIKEADFINNIVTISKLIPIVIFIVLVCFGFKSEIFINNMWGGGTFSLSGVFEQVRGTMLITVFVFLGIEGASVYSRYAKNRKDVGVATLLGFLGVLLLLVLITILSYGVMDRSELASLRNPSMAGVLQAVVGEWGAILIGIGLLVAVLGAYLSWSLLAAEVLYTAAVSGTMPSFLKKENENSVPSASLWMTNITIQVFLIVTMLAREAFTLAIELTSSMNLIPYLLVAAYGLKLATTGESYSISEKKQRTFDLFCGFMATVFATWLLYAGGLKYLLLSSVLYGPGTALFVMTKSEQSKIVFSKSEWLIFLIAMIGAIVAIYYLITGYIVI